VYARVVLANRDVNPELSCIDTRGKAAEFGGLIDGYMFHCSIRLARSLLQRNNVCLKALGKWLSYEVAVGMNGRVYVKTAKPEMTVVIVSAIKNSENLTDPETVAMVEKLVGK
jgi:exosome complex component RRP40